MPSKTESELAFEKYLGVQRLKWRRIPDSAQKEPDFFVEHGSGGCFVEIKEFDGPRVRPVGGFSPCPAIHRKIKRATKQFRGHRSSSCALVLWSSKSISRSIHPEAVLSAAFGERFRSRHDRSSDLGAEPPAWQFFGSAALTPTHNRTISSIVVLAPFRLDHLRLETWKRLNAMKEAGHEIQPQDQFNILEQLSSERPRTYSFKGTLRTITLENPYARVPFPADLLAGSFDQSWRMRDGWFEIGFIGSELKRLRQDGVPFIYL